MAGKMPKKSVKVAKKAAAKRVAAKAAKPRKAVAKSSARRPTKATAEGLSMTSTGQGPGSELITARIRELRDWRGEKLALVRRLIHEADPTILEEWKWGTPVWSHDGIVCTGETYKQIVKLTFAKGAFLADPHHLFNAGLTGNARRAIDLRAQYEVDGPSLRELIREAVAFNQDHPPRHCRAAEPTGAAGKGERSISTKSKDPDEELVASWIRQASELPGWVPSRRPEAAGGSV